MKLFICEKPSQGRDIASVLGANKRHKGYQSNGSGDLVVTWCLGHMVELLYPDEYDEKYKSWAISLLPFVPEHFRHKVIKDKRAQYNIVIKLLKKANHLVLATDSDREGELIGREMIEDANYDGPMERLWLSALDDKAIKRALNDLRPGSSTESLYHAAIARSQCDWLVGMNLSRLYTAKANQVGYEGTLSVGRVQTPTLRLVVDRDRLIENFRPISYWTLQLPCHSNHEIFTANWIPDNTECDEAGHCVNQQLVIDLANSVSNTTGTIVTYEKERKEVLPPLPFSIDTLVNYCGKVFKMKAAQVHKAAQSLYEVHKVTSYLGTDCEYLPKSQLEDVPEILNHLSVHDDYEQAVINANQEQISKAWNDDKLTAHHAIIPTSEQADLSKLTNDERKVYDIICRYYIAQFYPPYVYDQTVIELEVAGKRFKATGRTTVDSGFKAILGYNNKKDKNTQALPQFNKGDGINTLTAEVSTKQTKPPAYFTDHTLLAAMKHISKYVSNPKYKKVLISTTGIGTPRTRPNIIQSLLDRDLFKRQKNKLISTETGRSLIDALPDEVKSPETTALWEQSLESIVEGNVQLQDFMHSQIQWIQAIVSRETSDMTSKMKMKGVKQYNCPQCKTRMKRLLFFKNKNKNKKGYFWICTNDNTVCDYTAPDNNGKPGQRKKVLTSERPCPECGKQLVLRSGKKGKFWGCTGFRDGCKFSANDNQGKPYIDLQKGTNN